MDSYLQIAEAILRQARRPLSPRAILSAAYHADIVPHHLFGDTQYKTLQARLSEDILTYKHRSRFFRTEPGRFFLREFLTDPTIPVEHRTPIRARRRTRTLLRGHVLSIHHSAIPTLCNNPPSCVVSTISQLLNTGQAQYQDAKHLEDNFVMLWSFAIFQRGDDILTYRLGRYRDDRSDFISKRTIGFPSLVDDNDRTLFGTDDFGLIESALNALTTDLDIPHSEYGLDYANIEIRDIIPMQSNSSRNVADAVLAVVTAKCPEWFEPTKQRLSMNDLRWIPFSVPPNDITSFDPWSQSVIRSYFNLCETMDDSGTASS